MRLRPDDEKKKQDNDNDKKDKKQKEELPFGVTEAPDNIPENEKGNLKIITE